MGTDVSIFGFVHYPNFLDPSVQVGFAGTHVEDRAQLGVHGAYQLTDSVLIGTHAALGYGYREVAIIDGVRIETQTQDLGIVGLLPFVEVLFSQGNVRPYLGVEVGFQLLFVEEPQPFGFDLELDTYAMFIAGGLGGVHIFLDEGFSLSPGLAVDFVYNEEINRAGYQLALLLSFEGWIN